LGAALRGHGRDSRRIERRRPAALQPEFRALLAAHGGDPIYQAPYARTLVGSHTPEAIPLLEKAAAFVPRDCNWR
jgi:hypothetical protein